MRTDTTPTPLPEPPTQSLCRSCVHGLVRVLQPPPEYGTRMRGVGPIQQTFCTHTPGAGEIPPDHVVSACSHYAPRGEGTPARRTPGPTLD